MALNSTIISSNAATILKFINNISTYGIQFVGEFIFHYNINPSTNLKQQFVFKYGSTVIKSFVGTVLTTIFGFHSSMIGFYLIETSDV